MDLTDNNKPDAENEDQGFLPLNFDENGQTAKSHPAPVPNSDDARESLQRTPEPPAEENASPEPEPDSQPEEVIPEAETKDEAKKEEKAKAETSSEKVEPKQEEKQEPKPPQQPKPTAVEPPPPVANPEPEKTATKAEHQPKHKSSRDSKGLKFSEFASVGRVLHEARVSSGLSLKEVEEETRIRTSYLEALEHDNFKELPPPVYVKAYIRSLCGLYNLGREIREEIQHSIRENIENIVSEEIIQHLENEKQVNVEDEAKVKRFFIILSCAAAVVILLIAGSIFFMISGRKKPPAPAVTPVTVAEKFDPKKLDQFTPFQGISLTLLPAPKNDGNASESTAPK